MKDGDHIVRQWTNKLLLENSCINYVLPGATRAFLLCLDSMVVHPSVPMINGFYFFVWDNILAN